MKNRILALLAALALAIGLPLATAAPAQAFTAFEYHAVCPLAWDQQLVIQNYSGSAITVVYKSNASDTQWYPLTTAAASSSGAITYVPIIWEHDVYYKFYGSGNLNWYYHVDCFVS